MYPRNCPDSITKVTVWKRYNDFRKLHRAVKDYCKLLNTQEKLPNLSKASYFRRLVINSLVVINSLRGDPKKWVVLTLRTIFRRKIVLYLGTTSCKCGLTQTLFVFGKTLKLSEINEFNKCSKSTCSANLATNNKLHNQRIICNKPISIDKSHSLKLVYLFLHLKIHKINSNF